MEICLRYDVFCKESRVLRNLKKCKIYMLRVALI